MLIGHLFIFFGETSIQILCPFLNWVNFFIVELLFLFFPFCYLDSLWKYIDVKTFANPRTLRPRQLPPVMEENRGQSPYISVSEWRHSRPQGMIPVNMLISVWCPYITPEIRILLVSLHRAQCLLLLSNSSGGWGTFHCKKKRMAVVTTHYPPPLWSGSMPFIVPTIYPRSRQTVDK